MIIRLAEGGLLENLMLTPVVREVHLRYGRLKRPMIETMFPWVFAGNPHVAVATEYVARENEPVVNLDIVEWPKSKNHIMDSFSEVVLGDSRLTDRHIRLYPVCKIERKKTYVIELGECSNIKDAVGDYLKARGYQEAKPSFDLHDLVGYRDAVESASLYIGLDMPQTYVAMATDTPMVVSFGWRDETMVRPFRRGVPCVCVGSACPERPCPKVLSEQGVIYGVDCEKRVCESDLRSEDFIDAVKKVLTLMGGG